ncbi:YDG domain-containing protein [Hyphomonas beringensis]|uniref:two-partner secretion domain-containing protein n=1 Tax=Hyphomonas beringensis TaxID=1280946 RepID=UPI00138E4060|nr:YDG domain-containing protein [Hyphomonas beringensis]
MSFRRDWLSRASALTIASCLTGMSAWANPEGGQVTDGAAVILGQGTADVTITQSSQRAVIDWETFSIDENEQVVFEQPGVDSITANRVNGVDPSTILGSLKANGQVVLVNRNGILFGKGARVDAAGLIATTSDLDTDQFMAGSPVQFVGGGLKNASVVNQGRISIRDAGIAAFVAPHVRNSGVIEADLGSVTLASGTAFTLDFYGDGLIKFSPGEEISETLMDGAGEPVTALVENDGTIRANGGRVLLTASAGREVVNQSINISGIVRADSIRESKGVITLAGSGDVRIEDGGVLSASGASGGGDINIDGDFVSTQGEILADGAGTGTSSQGNGGVISISGDAVSLAGNISASGKTGGLISADAENILGLSDHVSATGHLGAGGMVRYTAPRITENATSITNAQGLTHGGDIYVDGGEMMTSSGMYLVDGVYGKGGNIDLTAEDTLLLSTQFSATGRIMGGHVRIGGAFQGGKAPDLSKSYHDLFLGRWSGVSDISNARTAFANDGVSINVSSASGQGGTAVIWSDELTTFLGAIDARGADGGGAVEISSAGTLRKASLDRLALGGGSLLLDPKNLTIGDRVDIGGWKQIGVMQAGYQTVVVSAEDNFGWSVALNGAGDQIAIGAPKDYGFNNSRSTSGAVRLFTFDDDHFSNATFVGTIGYNYTGTGDVNFDTRSGDQLGSSVAMNAAGDRMAVGALGYDGRYENKPNSGAVYLYKWNAPGFSNYWEHNNFFSEAGGTNNLGNLGMETDDEFGYSVALNAAGDRLAIGATKGDGFNNNTSKSGDVYLISFADTNFADPKLEGMIGIGYTGAKDYDESTLNTNDASGRGLSFNAAGDRLAIGADGDDSFGRGRQNNGAVRLYSFTDNNFSGANLEAVIGARWTGGKNIDLETTLDDNDLFGHSVSLSADGTRLYVGAAKDQGATNQVDQAGAAYIFDFSDNLFSGGTHVGTIGNGYTGSGDINISGLDVSDYFGKSISQNSAGNLLVIGASHSDGPGNNSSNSGAVYLFDNSLNADPGAIQFSTYSNEDMSVSAAEVATQLAAGTDLTLQASNDITVAEDVTVTGSPASPGDLTLQAGRSILLNANITTQGGDVNLYANDTTANGVVDSERDSGAAVITMANGTSIDAGTGAVDILMRDGAGKTYTASGDITLSTITANSIRALNGGPTSGSGLVLNTGAVLTATGTDDAIVLAGDKFINNAGASALSASNGDWLVWSHDPANNTIGGLTYDFKQYNAVYGQTAVAQADGDGFLYTLAPTVTAGLKGAVTRDYNGTDDALSLLSEDNYEITAGELGGDEVTLGDATGATFDDKNAAALKTITATGLTIDSAKDGAINVYGYQLDSTQASGDIGEITPKELTVDGVTVDARTYDGTAIADLLGGTLGGGIETGDTVILQRPLTGLFADKNVGVDKQVDASGYSLSGADAGNYQIADPTYVTGTITAKAYKNVGVDKQVDASGYSLSGADAGNYQIADPTYVTGTITAKALTITGVQTPTDRVYDGRRHRRTACMTV